MTAHPTLTARIETTLLRGQNNREHHRVRAVRVAAEREATRLALADGDWRGDPVSLCRPELGARVTIVRPFVIKRLDGDNLTAACKAVRDEVAAFLGVDDASARLHWVYLQSPAVVTGRSTKPGRDRASPDHDTRPLVRIEVLPVGDIDPQRRAIRVLRAFARRVVESSHHVEDGSDCALCLAIKVLAETHDQEQP